ncbi:unnamed protein product [Didymodactylos carnosus]|uniref:Death domain-containing protein n=2 Tax=Didymodactylos carnosus TaxID=1234261 RepID=A0A814B4F8_9BILA|nr:unnamed protein product [Didymodactylos carnosus]CAF3702071.1 unnamed protein product [Didymodactylos carnosus]
MIVLSDASNRLDMHSINEQFRVKKRLYSSTDNDNLIPKKRHCNRDGCSPLELYPIVKSISYPLNVNEEHCCIETSILDSAPVYVNFSKLSFQSSYDKTINVSVYKSLDSRDISPIVSLSPHGMQFSPQYPVRLRLPLSIDKKQFEIDQNVIYVCHSNTMDNEPLCWQKLSKETKTSVLYENNTVYIEIFLTHFSLYKIIIDTLQNLRTKMINSCSSSSSSCFNWSNQNEVSYENRHEQKIKKNDEHSYYCQVYLRCFSNTNKFTLDVICSKDKTTNISDTNKVIIAQSRSSRKINKGIVRIRLTSSIFSADSCASEEECLTKYESNFDENDFDKQFALVSNKTCFESGVIGKIFIEHQDLNGNYEQVFELNLIVEQSIYFNHYYHKCRLKETDDKLVQRSFQLSDEEHLNIILNNYLKNGISIENMCRIFTQMLENITLPVLNDQQPYILPNDLNTEHLSCGCTIVTDERHLKISKKCNLKINDTLIHRLSEPLRLCWKQIGREFNFNDVDLIDIEKTYRIDGLRECSHQMLREWYTRSPDTCTIEHLITILIRNKLINIALNVHDIVTSYISEILEDK